MTADPDQIRNRIENTRSNLSADVNALTEKVSPGRVMARRVDRTREALTSVKDRIMGTADRATTATTTMGDKAGSMASEAAGRASDLASSAADTVASAPRMARQQAQGNPLAAGLIAFGAGWLVASLIPASRREQELAEQARDRIGEQMQPMAEQVKQAASDLADNLREPAQQAVESVRSTASDAASTVTDEGRAATEHVTHRAGEAKQKIGDRTS